MSRTWKTRVLHLLLYYSCWYSVLLGTLTFLVDYEQCNVIQRSWFKIYALAINVFQVITLPFSWHYAFQQLLSFEQNMRIALVDHLMAFVRLTVTILVICLRFRRERRLLEVLRKIFELDRRYFDKRVHEKTPVPAMLVLYMWKYLTTIVVSFIAWRTSLFMERTVNVATILHAIYTANVQNIIQMTIFHYMTGLLNIRWRYELINRQLAKHHKALAEARALGLLHCNISQTLRQLSIVAAVEMSEMMYVHFELTKLATLLSSSIQFIAVGVLLHYLLQYTIFGYYVLMLIDDDEQQLNFNDSTIFFFVGSYFVLLLDTFLFYWICDAVSRSYQRTGWLLQRYNELTHLPRVLLQRIEHFTLQLMQCRLQISAGNMFVLNRASALVLCAYIVKSTLILVQFEYENRLKQLRQRIDFALSKNITDLFDD